MTIDLLHNKIVKESITEGFKDSFSSHLMPRLCERFPNARRVVMYEDYLGDGFVEDGSFYYPLTLVGDGEPSTVWVRWGVSDQKSFLSSSPYSYIGDAPLKIEVADTVPQGFAERLCGRALDYSPETVRIDVEADNADPLALVGRYSQTFIDELAKQITCEIRRNLGVEGIEKSTIELRLVFASGTYMEHTSEGVTYRRLLLIERGCQPRDFWVKWQRTDGKGLSATANEHLGEGSIVFTLGEDVPQKIREKEFRFLAFRNPDKYQSAMGKKTVTEWRDIIKRAVKRGDLVKVETDIPESDAKRDVDREIAEILGQRKTQSAAPEIEDSESFASVVDLARKTLSELENSRAIETSDADTGAEDGLISLGLADIADSADTDGNGEEYRESKDIFDIAALGAVDSTDGETKTDGEGDFSAPDSVRADDESKDDGDADGLGYEDAADTLDSNDDEDDDADPYGTEAIDDDSANGLEEQKAGEKAALRGQDAPSLDAIEAMRAEIEAQVRLEYERRARERAEREADSLKAESDALRAENERLLALAKRAQEDKAREISERERLANEEKHRYETETERLRLELERRDREEARERDRLAEAARLAVLEQKRIEAEREERERELARIEAERLERERIDRERQEEARRIESERIRRLEDEKRGGTAPAPSAKTAAEVGYMSKHAKLIFRKTVDLNVIKRIKEIVEQTLTVKGKKQVQIHMKAYPKDATTICLDVLKMPRDEEALLVDIIKAIGTAGLGISKITLE